MLIMDLDNFKVINDTFGHAAGDEMIREMGNIIRTGFQRFRYCRAHRRRRICRGFKEHFFGRSEKGSGTVQETVSRRKVIYGKQEIGYTVSIGVAAIGSNTDDINNIEDLLKMADDALYKAKAKGRNCVATLETGMEGVTLLESKIRN